MAVIDDTKAKLRALRDRLAFELPRARVRSNLPAELVQRLQAALDAVSAAYAMPTPSTPAAAEAVEEARQEAVVEAHLVLHDWERWLDLQKQHKLKPQVAATRRVVEKRRAAGVEVRLLRYSLHNGDGREVPIADNVAARSARNATVDGIFVTMPKDELPQLGIGGVLQLATTGDAMSPLQARATIVRRDADGVTLRWLVDNDRTRRAIEAWLDAVRRSRTDR